jgi:hypothetical protein
MATQIALTPVDRVEVLTVIDNVVDVLLRSTDVAKRMGVAERGGHRLPQVEAPLLEEGHAADAPVAEHGLSFLVSMTLEDRRRTVLFDTGSTVDGVVHNLRVLGMNPGEIETVVLSHGHFDHTTGLNGLAKVLQPLPPLPDALGCVRHRLAIPRLLQSCNDGFSKASTSCGREDEQGSTACGSCFGPGSCRLWRTGGESREHSERFLFSDSADAHAAGRAHSPHCTHAQSTTHAYNPEWYAAEWRDRGLGRRAWPLE